MSASTPTSGAGRASDDSPDGRRRILIISDAQGCLQRLQTLLDAEDGAITNVHAPSEVGRACRRSHDLVVVDVAPESVAGVLREVRDSPRHARIPLLVEAGRISQSPELCGTLPRFRAMACVCDELIKLVLAELGAGGRQPGAHGML